MSKPRLHVVALPHTQMTDGYLSCAHTQKTRKFAKMMRAQGYDVTVYAGELYDDIPEGVEHVPLISEAERSFWFGDDFDAARTLVKWEPLEPYWLALNTRAAAEIARRRKPRDLLCLLGASQQPITLMFPDMIAVEWGVGYESIFSDFCAFESYAWMHYLYGRKNVSAGRAFDTVIPNFFDPDDFVGWESVEREGYLLFLGRVIERKGPHIAAMIAQRTGRKLVVAGPGGTLGHDGLVTPEGVRVEGDVDYRGEVGVLERLRLLAGAAALVVPTMYLEPFGRVAVEAMMCGTPVVAHDWGAFTETVTPKVGGRFHTLREGELAVEAATQLDHAEIAAHARERYSLDAVGPRYTEWFDRLETLWGAGWYASDAGGATIGATRPVVFG